MANKTSRTHQRKHKKNSSKKSGNDSESQGSPDRQTDRSDLSGSVSPMDEHTANMTDTLSLGDAESSTNQNAPVLSTLTPAVERALPTSSKSASSNLNAIAINYKRLVEKKPLVAIPATFAVLVFAWIPLMLFGVPAAVLVYVLHMHGPRSAKKALDNGADWLQNKLVELAK